jgi:hypothetical protein
MIAICAHLLNAGARTLAYSKSTVTVMTCWSRTSRRSWPLAEMKSWTDSPDCILAEYTDVACPETVASGERAQSLKGRFPPVTPTSARSGGIGPPTQRPPIDRNSVLSIQIISLLAAAGVPARVGAPVTVAWNGVLDWSSTAACTALQTDSAARPVYDAARSNVPEKTAITYKGNLRRARVGLTMPP